MRKLQNGVFVLLWVILGGLIALEIVLLVGHGFFVWSATARGDWVFAAVVGILTAVAAWTLVASSPRNTLTAITLAFMLAFMGLATWSSAGRAAIVPFVGVVALTACNAAGALKRHSPHISTTLVGCVAIVLAFGVGLAGCTVSALGALAGTIVVDVSYSYEPSPDGEWTLVTWERDPGAMGGVVNFASARKDMLGLVRVERILYAGDGVAPKVRWLDSRTVTIRGASLDIFNDTQTEDFSYPQSE
jgi:hypothetical protein